MYIWYKHYDNTFEKSKFRKYINDYKPSWVDNYNLNYKYYCWGIPSNNMENKIFSKRNIYIWKGDLNFI